MEAGINIIVVQDTEVPAKPDAIFPNNWFTAGRDGRVFIFPMKPANRRLEKSNPILEQLKKENYSIK